MVLHSINHRILITLLLILVTKASIQKEDAYLEEQMIFLLLVARNITSTNEIPDFDKIKGIGRFAFTSCMIHDFIGTSQLTNLSAYSFHAMHSIYLIDISNTKIEVIPQY